MPKVSVLIPAYNVEPYIRECMDSVLTQTLQDFEIICMDDKSTDKTLSILREYEQRDNRIHVYCHEENRGQSCGRNHALKYAVGEYVYMLDADDMIVPEALEELYDICSCDYLDVAGFETHKFVQEAAFESSAGTRTIAYQDTSVLNGREALVYCMKTESFSLSTPTFLIRRAYLNEEKIRFVEGTLHEDVGYIFELIVKASRVRFLHKVYFLRRIRAHSTMTQDFTDKNIEGYIKAFYKSFELEREFLSYFEAETDFKNAYCKWQRDIFGRLNQLYINWADVIKEQPGGNVNDEIRHVFEMVKLSNWRTEKLPIKECYVCGTGQYSRRAITAIGAQDILISGVLVLEKTRNSFCGFPTFTISEIDPQIPVIMSVSKYTRDEYEELLKEQGITNTIYLDF